MNITVLDRRNPDLSQNNLSVARSRIIYQHQIATIPPLTVRSIVVPTSLVGEREADQLFI